MNCLDPGQGSDVVPDTWPADLAVFKAVPETVIWDVENAARVPTILCESADEHLRK